LADENGKQEKEKDMPLTPTTAVTDK